MIEEIKLKLKKKKEEWKIKVKLMEGVAFYDDREKYLDR